MALVNAIQGIAAVNSKKLEKVGISSVAQLLEHCSSRKGRKKVASDSGIDEGKILKWANHADLCRVKGIAGQYAELLEATGVDSVKELAKRKPANLHEALVARNNKGKKRICGQNPGLSKVEGWVAEAKKTKPAVSH